jgi:hypothetical protein
VVVLDKLVANHVGHGQRAVIVALFTGHPVELLGQHLWDGDSEPDDAFVYWAIHDRENSK